MSYRSQKRRLQRKRHWERVKWWQECRQYNSNKAFQEWTSRWLAQSKEFRKEVVNPIVV